MTRWLTAAAVLVLGHSIPAAARASTVAYHLAGKVTRIQGAAQSGLASLGVTVGASVAIDWSVDLATPIQSHNEPTHTNVYVGAIKTFTIQVGSWTATGMTPAGTDMNRVQISHTSSDHLDLQRSGSDTGSTVTGGAVDGSQLILHLFDPSGKAGITENLGDQNPSLYLESTGAVSGTNGEVAFAIPGTTHPVGDPTAKCRAAQLAAAGTLCQSTFKCLAAFEKAPGKDPGSKKLGTCEDAAVQKFLASYDKAAANAAKKGLSCGTDEPGTTLVSHFDAAVADVTSVVDSVNPDVPALDGAWLTDAGALCGTVEKAISKNATKPDLAKLEAARAKAKAKLILLANQAVAKAESKGVVFDPEPDVTAFVDSIDTLIDDVVNELEGA
jgi:hypothetical protein